MILLADLHLNPSDDAVKLYGSYDDVLCLVGDTFNILPFDLDRWNTPEGRETINSVGRMSPDVIVLEGNHDPIKTLKRLPLPDNLTVLEKIETKRLEIRHGHEFTYWKFLQVAAPWFCSLVADKKLWFKFCEKMGWTATHKKMLSGFSKEVALYWAACMNHCEKTKKSMIVGHAHNEMKAIDGVDNYTLECIFRTPLEVEDERLFG